MIVCIRTVLRRYSGPGASNEQREYFKRIANECKTLHGHSSSEPDTDHAENMRVDAYELIDSTGFEISAVDSIPSEYDSSTAVSPRIDEHLLRESRRLTQQAALFREKVPYNFDKLERVDTDPENEDRKISERAQEWFAEVAERIELGDIDKTESMEGIVSTKSRTARQHRRSNRAFTLSAIVNRSEPLQRLVDVGVDLSKVEKMPAGAQTLAKLSNYDLQVEPVFEVLRGYGIKEPSFGRIVSVNPYIFNIEINQLATRLDYYRMKKFTDEMIVEIVMKNPLILNFTPFAIDKRLGWLQTEFSLTGDEVRSIVLRRPKLVTFGVGYVQLMQFCLHEELGFSVDEMRRIMVECPSVWLVERQNLTQTFNYLHNEIKFGHDRLMTYPRILKCSKKFIKSRHEFLRHLNRDQYDPEQPNYVSLQSLVKLSNGAWCKFVAKSNLKEFDAFVKCI